MNKTMPVIRESADELKRLLKQERHHVKHQRLQMLYLVASGQARFRTELAPLLGVDRSTIGRWLAVYETGGLAALLAVYSPAGKKPPLSVDQLAQLQQALQSPTALPPTARFNVGLPRNWASSWATIVSTPSSMTNWGPNPKDHGLPIKKRRSTGDL